MEWLWNDYLRHVFFYSEHCSIFRSIYFTSSVHFKRTAIEYRDYSALVKLFVFTISNDYKIRQSDILHAGTLV